MNHLGTLIRSMHLPRHLGPFFFASSTLMVTAYRMSRATLSTTRLFAAPAAKKVMETIYFGTSPLLPDQYRGPNPMNPPKTKVDYYNWLRDETREDETVLSHIKAENAYCESQTTHLKDLQSELYDEMLSHLKETDEELPFAYGDFYYYSRTVKGKAYKIHCRKPLSAGLKTNENSTESVEQVVLDENVLGEGQEYLDVGSHSPSPDHSLLAYSVDFEGSEVYTLAVKNILTGELLPDTLEEINEFEWGADSSTLFYLKMDEEQRPNRLYMHVLGTDQDDDVLLLTEDDKRYWMGIGKSSSDRFIVAGVESKETSEYHVADLQAVKGGEGHKTAMKKLVCMSAKKEGLRYEVEHRGSDFFIVTNKDGAKNNKLMSLPVTSIFPTDNASPTSPIDSSMWKDVKPYNSKMQIDAVHPFKDFSVITGREEGLERIWLTQSESSEWRRLEFPEASHSVWLGANCNYDSTCVRIGYSSLITPKMTLEHHVLESRSEVLKEQEVPLYDPAKYESKRIHATSRDGRLIPISLVYSKEFLSSQKKEGQAETDSSVMPIPSSPMPLLLYGYGSYGACMDPTFDYKRTVLLDRGVVYAIAHIRGGGEMLRYWYEDEGKYLTKKNTFNDFADCATHLSNMGVTSKDHLAIVGRSAGGLLIGACINMFPSLFKAAVADVPFVDVINTMSDPSIPLTATEWEEWGNPNEEKYFSYMESYSPYDNVVAQDYPAVLVTAGLHDPRVAYWEPAKWVAKLRELKTDKNDLLLKTDLSSGHFSASDRYKFLKETAFEYSFILDQISKK